MCPTCEHIAVFRFNDEDTLQAVRDKLQDGVRALQATCPNHAVDGLQWMMNAFGKKSGDTQLQAGNA